MLVRQKSSRRRNRASFPTALLIVIGCGLALAACAPGSGFDRRQAYRDAAAKCGSAPDMVVCRDEEAQRIIDEGYASICRAKGVADKSQAMSHCKGELAYADCVRSISDYQGYVGQMSNAWQPPPSAVCKSHLVGG